MKYILIILAFLPLVGWGQICSSPDSLFIIYADVDWDSASVGYMTDGKIDTVYNDFDTWDIVGYYDSTKVMTDDSYDKNFVRAVSAAKAGCCEDSCELAASPSLYVYAYGDDSNNDSTVYVSFDVRFAPNFLGGSNGGKLATIVSAKDDSTIWDYLLNFQNHDSALYIYYYTYNVNQGTYMTNFRFYRNVWYNITMRVVIGTQNNFNGQYSLYVDGICVASLDDIKLVGDVGTAYSEFGGLVHSHFFGGGGCNNDWQTYVDFGQMKVWWPSDEGLDAGLFREASEYSEINDTIPVPINFTSHSWNYCNDFSWETGCGSFTTIDARDDCEEETPEATTCTTYEHYIPTFNNQYEVNDANIEGQSFTVGTVGSNTNHEADSIALYAYRVGSPGTITVALFALGDDAPTGDTLAKGTFNGNSLTTSTAGERVVVELSSNTLYADSSYVWTATCTGADGVNEIYLKCNYHEATGYAGGKNIYYTTSWGSSTNLDFGFEICGHTLSSVTGTAKYKGINYDKKLNGVKPRLYYKGVRYQ